MKDLTLKFNETIKDKVFNSLCWIIVKGLFFVFFFVLFFLISICIVSVFSLFTGIQKTYRNIVRFIFQKDSFLPRQCLPDAIQFFNHLETWICDNFYWMLYSNSEGFQICIWKASLCLQQISAFFPFSVSEEKYTRWYFIQKSIARLME